MESVVAFSAIAAGLMVGLGALGAGVGIGILGSKFLVAHASEICVQCREHCEDSDSGR